MSGAVVDRLVESLMYEGYMLYPYRPSLRKNHRERFMFGRVGPGGLMQTQCLARGGWPTFDVSVRFLQPLPPDENGWQHSEERTVSGAFSFPPIEGLVEVERERLPDYWKLTVRVRNLAVGADDERLLRTLTCTHTIVQVTGGTFVSAIDAPGCRNIGAWPVLIGDARTMVASPIVLPDYPAIAPEAAKT